MTDLKRRQRLCDLLNDLGRNVHPEDRDITGLDEKTLDDLILFYGGTQFVY